MPGGMGVLESRMKTNGMNSADEGLGRAREELEQVPYRAGAGTAREAGPTAGAEEVRCGGFARLSFFPSSYLFLDGFSPFSPGWMVVFSSLLLRMDGWIPPLFSGWHGFNIPNRGSAFGGILSRLKTDILAMTWD
jgi:hypothetical protein